MSDRLQSLRGGLQSKNNESLSPAKIELPDGMDAKTLLNRRGSTSITANLLETLPSKMQLTSNDNTIAAKITINTNANKSENQNPKFNSFLRRSSAAFIGDLGRIKPGAMNGSSIPEEHSDLMASDKDHSGSSSTMRRASIQAGVNIFQKEGMKSRGNLLSTVNGNFTAATRTGLLSNPRFQC